MATSQERFAEMMRVHVAPALRAMGCTGSGQVYTLPNEHYWVLLGFQRSQWSDRRALRFTVNLTVAGREMWARERANHAWLPARPSANTNYGGQLWQARIGSVMPAGQDRWWQVEADGDVAQVAADVIAAIRDHAIPEMHARMG